MEVVGKVNFQMKKIIMVNWLSAAQKLRKMVNRPGVMVIDVLRKLLALLMCWNFSTSNPALRCVYIILWSFGLFTCKWEKNKKKEN